MVRSVKRGPTNHANPHEWEDPIKRWPIEKGDRGSAGAVGSFPAAGGVNSEELESGKIEAASRRFWERRASSSEQSGGHVSSRVAAQRAAHADAASTLRVSGYGILTELSVFVVGKV